jgi:multiple sugar transport system ATP-binding protein
VPAEASARIASHVGREILMGIRPEHIRVASAEEENRLWAVVERIESRGADACVHLRAGSHLFVARMDAAVPATVNERVPVTLEMPRAHFFEPDTERAIGGVG